MRTREQDRMDASWEALRRRGFSMDQPFKRWQNQDQQKKAQKYLTSIKRTASRIHTSGLGQALAFLKSHKGVDPYNDLSELTMSFFGQPDGDLLAQIRNRGMTFLMLATDEALVLCGWLSRYLEGVGVEPVEEAEG